MFRLCAAGGIVVGLLTALDRYSPADYECEPGKNCVGRGIQAGMEPFVEPLLLWGGLGLLAGVALSLTIQRVGRSRG